MIITGRQAVLTAVVADQVILAEEVHIRLRHIHHSVQVHHSAVHQEEPEPEDIINNRKDQLSKLIFIMPMQL